MSSSPTDQPLVRHLKIAVWGLAGFTDKLDLKGDLYL